MSVEIVEILRRSEQGVTEPFICRAEDGEIYFVKGRESREGQIFEWIAGNLAKELGLPIADFDLVEVPVELLESLSFEWQRALGSGLAFGSRERKVNELKFAGIEEVPAQLKKDIFLFDAWIMNQDRTLFEEGGNPNLFWDPLSEELVVIDHNNAFDHDATVDILLATHVFRDFGWQIKEDLFLRRDYTSRLDQALMKWDQITNRVPEHWFYADDDMTAKLDIDLERILDILFRYKDDSFWAWE